MDSTQFDEVRRQLQAFLAASEYNEACDFLNSISWKYEDSNMLVTSNNEDILNNMIDLLVEVKDNDQKSEITLEIFHKISKNRLMQSSLAKNSKFRNHIVSIVTGMENEHIVHHGFEILYNLSCCKDGKTILYQMTELFDALADSINGNHNYSQSGALKLLSQMSYYPLATSNWILSENPKAQRILSVIISSFLKQDKNDGFQYIMEIIAQLAYNNEGGGDKIISNNMFPLIISLFENENEKPEVRRNAALTLANMSGFENHLPMMLDPSYNLFNIVMYNLVANNSSQISGLVSPPALVGCDSNSSTLSDNINVTSSSFGGALKIEEVLIRFLWGISVNAGNIMQCITHNKCDETILSHLKYIFTSLGYRSGKNKSVMWGCRLLVRFVEHGNKEVVMNIISHNLHLDILNIIRHAGNDVTHWDGDRHVHYCMSFLMYLSRFRFAIESLKGVELKSTHGFDAVELMTDILTNCADSSSEGLKAMIALAFLIGRDENNANILNTRPDIISFIVDVLHTTLKGEHGMDYRYGTFKLKLTLDACLALSVSDTNKKRLADGPLISLLIDVLTRYVENSPPVAPPKNSVQPSEGGGNDVGAAELAIETLLQLSFVFVDNDALVETIAATVIDLSNNILVPSPQSDKLSIEAKKNASFLKSMLENKKKKIVSFSLPGEFDKIALSRMSSQSSSHIMLSYCWSDDSNPQLVKELGNELRSQHGYDVWRDEEGSSLVKPMSGCTTEKMAEAIELASVVIIFVSQEYKESANCRMEGDYALQRKKKGKLDIIFVMMQEHYTTVSTNACDGWLGLIIGGALWYKLFDAKDVVDTAARIAQRIGDNTARVQAITPSVAQAAKANSSRLANANMSLSIPDSPSKVEVVIPPNTMQRQASGAFKDSVILASLATPPNMTVTDGKMAKDACATTATSANAAMKAYVPMITPRVSVTSTGQTSTSLSTSIMSTSFPAPSPDNPNSEVRPINYGNNSSYNGYMLHSSSKLEEAYGYVNNPACCVISSEMDNLLDMLGVGEADDLNSLEWEDILIIARNLKKAKRRKFLNLLSSHGTVI